MLSIRLYQAVVRPNIVPNLLRNYPYAVNKHIVKNSHRFIRVSKNFNSSHVTRLAIYGLAGSIVTYVSCAIWEYENIRSNMFRKSFFKTQFTNIFGRPPMSSDIFWVIAGINTAIFTMMHYSYRYNTIILKCLLQTKSDPVSLFLSTFTHTEVLHFAVNMYVLYSCSSLMNYIGAPHFVAIYITGGAVASLSSIMYRAMYNIRRPTVGASGSILSILALFATIKPNAKFGLPIISDIVDFQINARMAVGSLLIFDVCSLLFLKSSRLDHVCHISAVLFGIFYGFIGRRVFWETRKTWMSWYYSMRS